MTEISNGENDPRALHAVGLSHTDDDSDEAEWHYFDAHADAVEFASSRGETFQYIWMCERGTYLNENSSWVDDWMYYWWSPAAVKSESGQLPESHYARRFGVPEDKSWGYHVEYRPHDPERQVSN